ncbi:uncharacterized protein LOC117078788 [Trachypithecus francoisi]|uniref:uncharacterized protein LOC117078788 n=1 Tax=Trachypithecus francoisi TaxID=54180 RepID=UPI00141B308D|nr:uncharacterized protein LOC117078788 [Trachypithecus francoisi]
MDIQLHLFYGYTECICPCGYPRPADTHGLRIPTACEVSKAHPSVPGPVTRTGKEDPEGHRRHREPQLGPGRSESPLRALLTSLEPRGLREASRGTRCPQGGGWGRAPARRTAPSPDSAPPLPQSKRWRTRKLPRTGTDFRANRAAALAFSGGSDAIGSCGRRAEMSKVKAIMTVSHHLPGFDELWGFLPHSPYDRPAEYKSTSCHLDLAPW